MVSVTLADRKQFILTLDASQNRDWRVWANGVLVQQSNGSNPRIKRLSPERMALLPGVEDVAIAYEVRVIKDAAIASLIRADVTWALSFDSGTTQMMVRCVPPIAEHSNPGLAWIIYLRK